MSALEMNDIPADFPVVPVTPTHPGRVYAVVTCGECGLSWDDTVSTSYTPTPSGRCPFEAFHEMDEPDEEDEDEIHEIHAQGLHITVTHSEGSDGALLVMIDTTSEPDGSDSGRGVRVLLNDEPIYNVVPYRPRVAR